MTESRATTWTPEREAQLIELNSQGLSVTHIANIMGYTRSAIAGKRRRLNLTVVGEEAKRRSERIKAAIKPGTKRKVERKVSPPLGGVFLADIEPHHCRYPLGLLCKPLVEVCGASRLPNSSYCAKHYAKCYRPVPKET